MSIKANLLAPTAAEPGGQIKLDASRSYNTASPFAQLSYKWSQTAGPACAIEFGEEPACIFHIPKDAEAGQTIGLSVTVSDKATGESAVVAHTMTLLQLIGDEALSLNGDVSMDALICPRGLWDFAITFATPDGSKLDHETLRRLSPSHLYAKIGHGSSLVDLPIIVWRERLDRWRVLVEPSPAGEQLLETHTEQVKVELQSSGAPMARLRRPAAWIEDVLWIRDGADPEVVPLTAIQHTDGSSVVAFHEKYKAGAEDGSFNLLEVRYYSQNAQERTGWYSGLGLGPFDNEQATLYVYYGDSAWVDPALDVEGNAWDARELALWRTPVRISGTLRLRPYYHIWMRQGDVALLREHYEGVVRE